ncbi:MAG: hypothetical protein JNM57_05395 [Cyclobacteriaceae bacterium]|nr:hypothetical protein [Cyclobacteriaceae bacterium]
MKKLILTLLALTTMHVGCSLAQSDTNHKQKLKIFESWIGHWQGEGFMKQGPGEGKRSIIDERLEYKLDGGIILIEGIGKTIDPNSKEEIIVHHAIGILSFNPFGGEYAFKSYLQDSRSTDAWFKATSEHTFEWGFDIPQGGKTKYSIVLNPNEKTWNEIGEYSRDGNTWMKFFEMNLKKISN